MTSSTRPAPGRRKAGRGDRRRRAAIAQDDRNRAEDRYRAELAAAILDFLAFPTAHHDLAVEIADGAAARAAAVGSGRVGRTRTLSLEERAGVAARAWIRHPYTDYEDRLAAGYGEDLLLDELDYRATKSAANPAVDDFIAAHRHA